ncbi:hypothetical protein ACVWXQ_000632 [Bradyrhizobium sp. S3.14.4]
MLEFKATREVGFGSKCEELRVSKISPLHPTKPTSMKGVVTSLMGHVWTYMDPARLQRLA